ncbi:MAG: hypothetical protein WCB00_24275 [Candidatus Acidiferrales bacterium]
MSIDFTRENPELEKAISACKSPLAIREAIQKYQESNGLPSFDNRYAELPAPTAVAFTNVEVASGRWVRVEGYTSLEELNGIVEVLRRRAQK